jgi:hypothetical protein
MSIEVSHINAADEDLKKSKKELDAISIDKTKVST